MGHAVVGIGDECGEYGAHVFASRHFLFLPHSECLVERGVGVGNQRERERIFLCKLAMRGFGIFAYAYKCISHGDELSVTVAQ